MNNTKLKTRILWFDGDVTVKASDITPYLNTSTVFVDEITPDIIKYNTFVDASEYKTVKTTCNPLDFKWNLPSEYLTLDVKQYVLGKLGEIIDYYSDFEAKKRISRVLMEYKLFEKLNLINTLQAIIYIINRLEVDNIVWGVGRGSSVSSYILYVIGVHDIDSVEFDLDIHDFLKE